ncbi:MAG: hypothetical protein R6X13_06530 [bacterium]
MTLQAILDWHLERYPLLGAVDLYKLIHQGVYGPGHIIIDAASAREYLEREHAAVSDLSDPSSLTPDPRPLVPDPLSPDARFIRVNLRGLDSSTIELLLAALLESAREVPVDHATMRERLLGAIEWSRQRLPGAEKELRQLLLKSEPLGFPARHHSTAYRVAYRPAYRVVKPGLFSIVD